MNTMQINNQYDFFKNIKLNDDGHLILSLNETNINHIEDVIEETIKRLLISNNVSNSTLDYNKSFISVEGQEKVNIIEVEKVAHYIKNYSKRERTYPKIEIKIVKKLRRFKRKIYLTHKEQEERYLKKIIPINSRKLQNIL